MATLASSKIRIATLLAVARDDFYMNNMGGKTTIAAIEWLESNGYVDFKTTPRDGYLYFVTPKGIEALDAHMPMVDQPQPAPVDDNDDLPFSDVGNDDEDTKPLPVMQHTPCNPTRPTIGDAIKLPLSNLIDAALDPDNTEAYETLKAYDWSNVPLWVAEIERDDVNAYKWEQWHILRKMAGGIRLSTPEAVQKNREVERAFNVMTILNNAIYGNYKGVGFNVLD